MFRTIFIFVFNKLKGLERRWYFYYSFTKGVSFRKYMSQEKEPLDRSYTPSWDLKALNYTPGSILFALELLTYRDTQMLIISRN